MRWCFLIVGVFLFITGLIFYIKNIHDKRRMKLFGTVSYCGFGFAVLGATLLLEPFLQNVPTLAVTMADLILLIMAAYFLLRPAFRKKE